MTPSKTPPLPRTFIADTFGESGGRTGRWRHQAGQDAVPRPPGSRCRKLPQDDAGDVARPARDPDQAGRPPAQHAHAGMPRAPNRARRIALETLEIYAPIAQRLGMNLVKAELQDLGFRALYPLRYRIIAKRIWPTSRCCAARRWPPSRPSWRSARALKTCRSGWCPGSRRPGASTPRCATSARSFNQVMDVFGFRIVVKKVTAVLPGARRSALADQAA